MGWEHRKGKGQYYTRSWREDGRIVRQYIGAGALGQIAAAYDRQRREKARDVRDRERLARADLQEIGDLTEDYYRRVNAVLDNTLALAGYHRHCRGEWRKTRKARGEADMRSEEQPARESAPQIDAEDKEIILRAQRGDESAREGFREIVAKCGPEGLRPLLDVARDDLLKKMSEKSIALEEDVRFQMESIREQLAGASASPLECLLAERVALCWLHLHYFEVLWAQQLGEVSQKQSQYHERCLESANRRYLAAIRSLAQVRRLQLPSLQLNLANQQINVADKQINLGKAKNT